MKKLTKRVQAGGLWFDVPSNSEYICFEFDGRVVSSESSIKPVAGGGWMYGNSHRCQVGFVDLEGADWRECCWYVGDQVDGEAVERREWMARGAEKVLARLENGTVSAGNYEGVCLSIKIGKSVLKEIRAGEAG